MDLDSIVSITKEMELNEDVGFVRDVVNRLGKMTWDMVKRFLKQKAQEFVSIVKDNPYADEKMVLKIINSRLGTSFSDVRSIFSQKLMENVDRCDEGLKDWWKEASGSLYGALSFYPLLTTFLELDKIVKDTGDANIKTMSIYFIIWALVVSGKVLTGKMGKNDVKASLHPDTGAQR